MTHSIPDASAVALTTDLGTILITGDYKFDQTPVDGKPADVTRLAELGREGLLLLCGDSTNGDRPGFAPTREGRRAEPARRLQPLQGPHRRDVVRVEHPPRAAGRRRRRGARAQGLPRRALDAQEHEHRPLARAHQGARGDHHRPARARAVPRRARSSIISTGSQGEPLSALRRMAHRDHPQVELHAGDTVVFSATPIPGNERAVNETIDRLYHIGCDVITTKDAPIHASGHGYQEEIKLMLNLTRPRYVMPFHGDFKRIHLHAQARRVRRHRAREHLQGRERPAARARRQGRALGQEGAVGDDLRRRRRHRRRHRRRAARPPHALGRRHLRRRRDDLRAGRLVGRRARGHLPRRAVRRRGRQARSTSCATPSTARSSARPRRTSARSTCSSRSSTTTSPRSSTRSSSAARWCCRSSSRSERRGRLGALTATARTSAADGEAASLAVRNRG